MSETQVNDVAYGSMTIQGLQFDIKTPYKEGHMITAGEASQLNQVRMENIRNNFASVVRNAVQDYRKANGLDEEAEVPLDQLDKDDLDEKLSQYDDSYIMGVRGGPTGPRTPQDPVLREANRIAMEKVKVALKKKNIAISSVSKESMDKYITGVLGKYPDIMNEAKRRVNAVAEVTLADL